MMNEVKKLIIFALMLVLLSGIAAASGPFYLDKDVTVMWAFILVSGIVAIWRPFEQRGRKMPLEKSSS